MFDIGWTEMLVIAVVMILVVGPKDLPGTMAGEAAVAVGLVPVFPPLEPGRRICVEVAFFNDRTWHGMFTTTANST